jgi:transglutaminase-like putative cysteine protease
MWAKKLARGGTIGVVLSIGLIARADPHRMRHEYVPGVRANEGTLLISSGGEEPDALVYRGEILNAPEGGALRDDEMPMEAQPGDSRETEEPGRRSPQFRPDRVTELNGRIGYYGVFTPTITPFKRVTALDSVAVASDGTPILALYPSPRETVATSGASAEPPDDRARDRFWGSVVLDFSDGRTVPFPSVSPESRVLTLRTEPPIDLNIERDGADNFYAVADEASPPRQVRVVFLMDAPRSYFGMDLPSGARADALASRVHPMDSRVQRDALTFAAELGITPATEYSRALSTLVEHFRSFEESARGPRDTGNIYLDLSRGMRGVCRHRAYGFVITAMALGMPARFVENEAHAWSEVEVPGSGWLRVDLGGAAVGLDARGDENHPPYVPDVRDPLPRPEPYRRAYAQAAASQQQPGQQRGPSSPGAALGAGGDPTGADVTTGGQPHVQAGDPSNTSRAVIQVVLDSPSFEVFRGHELQVSGQARGGTEGIAGLRVEVLLRAPRGDQERLLGVTVTGEEGRFRALVGVPHDLAVGDYRLLVRTPGDEHWGPGQAM